MQSKIYEMVTNRIVDQLKQGIIPWNPHFVRVVDRHINVKTKKPYNFLNQILLSIDNGQATGCLTSSVWGTFKQWKDIGASIRRGEKAHVVLSWMIKEVPSGAKDAETGEDITETVIRPVYYSVFSLDQVEGIDKSKILPELPSKNEKMVGPQKILDDYWTREKINVVICESNKAYYSPSDDSIHLRALNQYDSSEHYYRTAFHESVHSTGHVTRLDRFNDDSKKIAFGGSDYSKEELVAELGSAFLMAMSGIETKETQEQNAAYIQGWLSALQNDSSMIVYAAAKAEKGVDYILD